MELTLPQIKTLLHALEVAVQKYEEIRCVEQHQVKTLSRYTNGSSLLVEPHEQAIRNCEVATQDFKNLELNLKKRYQIECDKALLKEE